MLYACEKCGIIPNMRRNTTKQRINHYLLTWIASYLLILIVPIALGAVVYSQAIRQLTAEVDKVNQKSLVEMRLILDAAASDLDRVNTNIALSETVSSLALRYNIHTASDLLAAQSAQRQLHNYMLSNRDIESIGVYFHRAGYLLTNNSSYRYSEKGDLLFSTAFGLTENDWKDMLTTPGINVWHFKKDQTGAPKIYILLNTATGTHARSDGVTCILSVNVSGKFITSLQNSAWVTSGDVWLVNDAGGFLTTAAAFKLPDAIYDATVHTRLEEPSAVHPLWRYVALSPKKVVYEKVSYIRQLIYLHLGVCILLGGFMAYFLARHYYDPISRISHLLAAHGEYNLEDEGKRLNQIAVIQSSLIRLLNHDRNRQSTLNWQRDELDRRRLRELLVSMPGADAREWLDTLFPGGHFLLVGFYVRDFSRMFGGQYAPKDEQLIGVIITNISEEMFGKEWLTRTVESSGLMTAVVNFSGDPPDIRQTVQTVSRSVIEIFDDVFGLDISVLISEPWAGGKGFVKAFTQLRKMAEYIHLVGDERRILFHCEMTDTQPPYLKGYVLSREQKSLCSCVSRGDYAAAIQYLDQLFPSAESSQLQLVNMKAFMVFVAFVNALSESGVPQEALDKMLESAEAHRACSHVQLRSAMHTILTGLCSDEAMGETTGELINRVEEYVADNYADPDLGGSAIAAVFRINPSQLSRSFKKAKKVGLLDHIHAVRIAHIKTLLASESTIKDIALQTGYLSSLSMIRVFKRYEGITPGKYREEQRRQILTP